MSGVESLHVVFVFEEGDCVSDEQALAAVMEKLEGVPYPEQLPLVNHCKPKFWTYITGNGKESEHWQHIQDQLYG